MAVFNPNLTRIDYVLGQIFVLSALLIATVTLSEEKIVRIATLGDYPPYCFYKEDIPPLFSEKIPPEQDAASFQGYSWDILRESLHSRGYTIQLIITPWSRALENVKTDQADLLFPTGKNSERMAYFSYSQTPINRAAFRVYVNPTASPEWYGLTSLHGLSIGVIRGYNFGDEWNENTQIIKHPLNTIEQGFLMLKLGRLDGFAGYEINWDYTLKQMKLQGYFKKLPVFGVSEEYLVGMKFNPRTQQFLDDFDEGLSEIKENGIYQKIIDKWR